MRSLKTLLVEMKGLEHRSGEERQAWVDSLTPDEAKAVQEEFTRVCAVAGMFSAWMDWAIMDDSGEGEPRLPGPRLMRPSQIVRKV